MRLFFLTLCHTIPRLETFLQKTAAYLVKNYADHLSELCIVLPNRRAGIFFKRHLSHAAGRTLWSPEIYSSEDFITHISGLEIFEPIQQLFELYNVYRKNKREDEIESFDEFGKWASTLLADFNEIDRYMVDAKRLFSNLGDIREIENWSLGNENLTEFQEKYIRFWDSLGGYYRDFSKRLLDKKKAYPGLAYRYVANNIASLSAGHNYHKIIFAGFNALNTAEERIIRSLIEAGKAEILWDADSYYTNNRNHEAGRFIRKYKTAFKGPDEDEESEIRWEENNLGTTVKNIEVIGAARDVAQAKVAGDIITKLQLTEEDLENTAIVLADERLLFPVLHSLPEGIKNVNVTMGFPLRSSPVAGLFELLFNLHETPLRFGKHDSFYHRDIIKLLSHPYINHVFATQEPVNRFLVSNIQQRNAVFLSVRNLERDLNEDHKAEFEMLKPLFVRWKSSGDALKCCYYLIDLLKQGLVSKDQKKKDKDKDKDKEDKKHVPNVELEFVFAYAKIIKRIRSLADDYGHITLVKTLRSIISQAVSTASIPFYGEPLRGLQVMGMLETRALDFRNIILLSANEKILPSGKSQNSFIPYDLKRVFGLPTHTDRDAVFAYHFYHLLQRSENAWLIYNTETDAMGSGEKSRFITQLVHELPLANPDARITEKLLDISVRSAPEHSIVVEKTHEVMEKIMEKGGLGFSPSLLNTYKYCPLKFYFQLVAGLEEVEEVEETIKADTLGTVVHNVLENLYKPHLDEQLSADVIKMMKTKVDKLAKEEFTKRYSSADLEYGKNLLVMKVALRFIHNFLDSEIKFIEEGDRTKKPLVLKALEKKLFAAVPVQTAQGETEVQLFGKADRIDISGGITRIIDYKTGIADNRELFVKEWEQVNSDPDLAKSFQLLMYAYMYQRANPSLRDNIQSGIVTFRQLSAGMKPVNVGGKDVLSEVVLKEFETQLKSLLNEIYDITRPFSQTASLQYCEFCSYRSVCNR